MPKLVRLTDTQVRKIKEPGRHAIDSSVGLYLSVPQTGAATFVVRKTVDGKRTLRVLGVADRMPLAVARTLAAETVQGLVQTAQEAAALADAPEPLPTFAEALQAYLDRKASGWREGGKSEGQWRQSMDAYALPVFGHVTINEVKPSHIVEALQPIWSDKPETARRVRQRISAVLTAEFRLRQMTMPDPADQKLIADLMPKVRAEVRHHPAPTIEQLQAARVWLDNAFASHRCLRFIVLHACRSGEARGATWAEFSQTPEGIVWNVPASRMKAAKAWQSPVVWLPPRPSYAADTDLVFEGSKSASLSDMAVLQVLRKRKLPWVPHGARSAFRSWVSAAGGSSEAAELQLAHTPGKLTQAYQRDGLMPQRRALLMAWKELIETDQSAQTTSTAQEALVEAGVATLP